MITNLVKKLIEFLKVTYPHKLRKLLFGILIIGLAVICVMTNYQQPSTINQRIIEREAQISQEHEKTVEDYAAYYAGCLQQEKVKVVYYSHCFNIQAIPLQTEMSSDQILRELHEQKNNLESGLYYFIFLGYFTIITLAIAVIRLFWLIGRLSWKRGQFVFSIFRSESTKMSSFQKYSLVLSGLILVALVAMILILLV